MPEEAERVERGEGEEGLTVSTHMPRRMHKKKRKMPKRALPPRKVEIHCDRCGEKLEAGDELVKCPDCGELVCTKICIAGRLVPCFQCEEKEEG